MKFIGICLSAIFILSACTQSGPSPEMTASEVKPSVEYQMYKGADGDWWWRLVNKRNGQNIASSGEGYRNEADCIAAIRKVQGSDQAPIVKVY